MTKLEQIIEDYPGEELLKADGFDEAVIGIDEKDMRLVYSVGACLGILMRGMSIEDAEEYFEFNVAGAYVGPKTPIWCYGCPAPA